MSNLEQVRMAEQDLGGMPLHEAAISSSGFVEANGLRFHYLEWGKPTDRHFEDAQGLVLGAAIKGSQERFGLSVLGQEGAC
jgi:hypothetical protein